jgi:hypothetical protein
MGSGFMLDFLGDYDFGGVHSSGLLVQHGSVSFLVGWVQKHEGPAKYRPGLHWVDVFFRR